MRITSSHCSASALPLMILLRVSFAKISAPPPGIESRPACLQLAQHLLDAHPVEAVEEEDLDRGEGLDVDVGPDRLDAPQHVDEVGPTAGRGGGRPRCGPRAPCGGSACDVREDLVERHRVAARLVRLRREGAEVAGGHAHVGVVDVGVPHEVGGVAVPLLAHVVGEPPEAEEVVGPVERDAVLEARAGVPARTFSRIGSRAVSWNRATSRAVDTTSPGSARRDARRCATAGST